MAASLGDRLSIRRAAFVAEACYEQGGGQDRNYPAAISCVLQDREHRTARAVLHQPLFRQVLHKHVRKSDDNDSVKPIAIATTRAGH